MDSEDLKNIFLISLIFFAAMFLTFLILESLFPSQGDGLSEGQRFAFQGEGELYLEGESCVLLLESKEGEWIVSPKLGEFGISSTTVEVKTVGEMQGQLISGKECRLRAGGNLEIIFHINFAEIFHRSMKETMKLMLFLIALAFL